MNKLIEWIKKNKIAALAVALFMTLIALLVYIGLNPITQPTPSPTPVITDQTPFFLRNITPIPPTFTSIRSTEPIIFEFSKPINSNTVKASIRPEIEFKVIYESTDPNKFGIVPVNGWDLDRQYTIVISKSLAALAGNQLSEDIVTTITRKSIQSGGLRLPGDED